MATSIERSEIKYTPYGGKEKDELPKTKLITSVVIGAEEIHKPKVIVAIPAFNEEVAIGSVVARCKKYVDTVYVIDDGSKDHTVEIAGLVGAEVVSHKKNGGYGAAIKTCFEIARDCDADVMVIIDADGQHSPDDIPALLEEIKKSNADIVIGSRFVNGNGHKQNIPAYRKVGMKVLDTATTMGTRINISDSQSGFRAYSKNAIKSIRFGNNGMAAGSEILLQAADNKLKITEIPINVRYDIKGSSSQGPITHGLQVLFNLIGFISQRRPLLFFCVPGIVLLIIGISFAFLTFIDFNATRNIPIFFALVSGVSILIGIFSIFTGFILASIQSIK